MKPKSDRLPNVSASDRDGLSVKRTAGLAVFVALAAAVFLWWCVARGYDINDQAKAVEIVKDVLTAIALVVGGFWTFRIYVKQRSDASAIDLKQSIVVIPYPAGKWLLKVQVAIRNIGKTRVQLAQWRYRADVLLPLTATGQEAITSATAFSELKAPWPTVIEATLTGEEFGFSIEPGATQVESANLVLPARVEVVQVYSFLSGPSNDIHAWWDRTVLDLRKETRHGSPATDTDESTTPTTIRAT